MRESFTRKEKGDRLKASEVNLLNDVCRTFGTARPNGALTGYHGSFFGLSAIDPQTQLFGKVVNRVAEDGDPENSGRYLVRLRYFDFVDELWKTMDDDDDKDYEIDTRCMSFDTTDPQRGPALVYGDYVVLHYDIQRGLLIPTSLLYYTRWVLTPDGGIPARNIAKVSSAVCKFVKETLSADGTEIDWQYLKDDDDNDVEGRVFNGYPSDVDGLVHIPATFNSIGQRHVMGHPCANDAPLP